MQTNPKASINTVETEAKRRLDTYGKFHRGYCFFGFRYANSFGPEVLAAAMRPIGEKATEYAFELLKAAETPAAGSVNAA